MIKEKNGKVKIKGTMQEVMLGFTSIVKAFEELLVEEGLSNEKANEIVRDNVEIALNPKGAFEKIVADIGKIFEKENKDNDK